MCGEGMGTKKTLTCGCRGTKVIHLHEGETKELVYESQGGQIINTWVYAVKQGIKMCVYVCVEGDQKIITCVWGRGTKELIHVYGGGGTKELIHVYGGGGTMELIHVYWGRVDQGINTCVWGRGDQGINTCVWGRGDHGINTCVGGGVGTRELICVCVVCVWEGTRN